MKQSVQDLRANLKRVEAKWLSADAAAHQARLVLEAAQERLEANNEGDAWTLIDAAKALLDRYSERGE